MRVVKESCFISFFIIAVFISCAGQTSVEEPAVEYTHEQAEKKITAAEKAAEEVAVGEDFVVTEEIYVRTFEEIEAFIKSLNDIISKKDYETWVTHLSDEYTARTSDPDYLREQSNKPILKKKNITLRGLEDFFFHVVVPSRIEAELDDIEFIDENHVKAVSIVRNRRGLLYLLVRVEDEWKIGVW